MRRLAIYLAVAFGLGILPAAALAQVKVQIDSPTADQPVFGPTSVMVEVQGAEPVDRVEVFVDNQLKGTAKAPPFNFQIDVGDDNVRREFRAVAHTKTGKTATSTVVTVPVEITEVMNIKLKPLFVTVTRGGRRDLSLTQEDFQVFDNGTPQDLVTFGRDELPLTAVLLLDTSGSMVGGNRVEAVRKGAQAFIDGMKPMDEAMLALFSDRLLQFTPFTEDKSVLARDLGTVEAAGGTAVNDFLYMSLKLLEGRNGQRVVVLFSDGSDVHSVLSASDALWKARTGQALIYWIQLTGGEKRKSFVSAWRDYKSNDREYEVLEKAVVESGGRIERIDRIEDLEAAFRGILRELREQYAVGYYPSNLKGDGSWHKVDVRVRGGGRARTREGYVDY